MRPAAAMLSDKQVKIIVRDVNEELNVPVVPELAEGTLQNRCTVPNTSAPLRAERCTPLQTHLP